MFNSGRNHTPQIYSECVLITSDSIMCLIIDYSIEHWHVFVWKQFTFVCVSAGMHTELQIWSWDVVKAICFIQLRFFKLHIHDEHHLEINILTCVSYYIYTKWFIKAVSHWKAPWTLTWKTAAPVTGLTSKTELHFAIFADTSAMAY